MTVPKEEALLILLLFSVESGDVEIGDREIGEPGLWKPELVLLLLPAFKLSLLDHIRVKLSLEHVGILYNCCTSSTAQIIVLFLN